MAFEFLSNLDATTTFLLLIIFILFILAMKKVMGILKNAVIIAVAAVMFPIVMNRFFGYDIPMDPDSIVSFILLGLGIYFVYLLARSIYHILKFTERFAKDKAEKIPKIESGKKEKDDKEEKPEKRDKEKERELKEREKELTKREQELKWKEKIESKKRKDWTKEYHTLENKESGNRDDEEKEINVSRNRSHVTPLPVIGEDDEEEALKKTRKKKKRKDKG